ncbi:MAG: hypothetical protein M3069_03260 [Chloroflexota bacterium]|nr:hypothetical protein [Chloroflexota bacterium]
MSLLVAAVPILFSLKYTSTISSRIGYLAMQLYSHLRRTTTCFAGVGLLVAASLTPGLAFAQTEARVFDSGYTIVDDGVWSFYSQHGGSATFGQPISREFTLMGAPVQLFQNAALQVQPDGSVQVMQLTDPGLLPYTHLNGLTVPAADPAVAFVTPSPDQPNYTARQQVFAQSSVPESWNGKAVHFWSTYTTMGGPDVWGLPTSTPSIDPNNPHFVYQRFQNGILLYDSNAGTTQALPLGEYLKEILSGQNLPADLASQAASSPLLRAGGLTSTDLTDAFVPDAA